MTRLVNPNGRGSRSLEHLQQFPNTSPYPHKTIILGTTMLFSCSSSSLMSLPFLVATNIFLISPQRKGEIQLPQYHGDHPSYHFLAIFSLTLLWDPPFIWVLEEIYWGTDATSPTINLEKWYWTTPIPSYWGSCIEGLLEML